MMAQPRPSVKNARQREFKFPEKARVFPVVDARPLPWPSSAREVDNLIKDWREQVSKALGAKRLSKKIMIEIASHTSRRDGRCTMMDAAFASRTGRSVASVKRDIGRLKKMGFLIAEASTDVPYRKRRRILQLAVPEPLDDDQRIPANDDQRIPHGKGAGSRSTYPGYVDPLDIGERRDV